MTRAALLARVSSEDQARDDRLSLDAQLRAMRRHCEAQGWEVAREFRAEGESAFVSELAKRPVTLAAIQAAEQHEFDALLIHESSRLARNVDVAREIRRRLRAAGVRLVDLSDATDNSNPEGRLFTGVKDHLHEYWSDKISQHITKAKRELFELGLPVGDVPFGYRRPEGGTGRTPLEVVPAEAAAIRQAFASRALGLTITAVTRELNATGLQPRSKVGRDRFTESSVCSMFENQFYAGIVTYRGEQRPGVHQAILTREEWLAAQPKAGGRRGHDPSRGTRALLTGLATCSACGRSMWLGGNAKAAKSYFYMERSQERGLACERAGTSFMCREADRQVSAVMASLALKPEWVEYMNRPAPRRPSARRAAEERRRELQRRRAVLVELRMAEDITQDEFRERAAALQVELDALPVEEPTVLYAFRRLEALGELWEELDARRRAEAVRMVLSSAVLDTKAKTVAMEPRENFRGVFALRKAWSVVVAPPAGFGGGSTTRLYTLADLGVVA